MDPFTTPKRVKSKSYSESAQWQIFTKMDAINFINSIDFADFSIPHRYTSSLDEESLQPFIKSFFAALSDSIFQSSPPKASPKKLLSRFHISNPKAPMKAGF